MHLTCPDLFGHTFSNEIGKNVQKYQKKTGNPTCLFGPEWLFGSLEYIITKKAALHVYLSLNGNSGP